jgi:hypothetical protein
MDYQRWEKKKEKKKHEPLKFKLRTFKLHQAWIVHTLYMVFSTSTIYNSQEKKKNVLYLMDEEIWKFFTH